VREHYSSALSSQLVVRAGWNLHAAVSRSHHKTVNWGLGFPA
jgi:hypothetical protein